MFSMRGYLNKKGFTLIEAVIMVVIVTLFLSAILPFTIENLTSSARSKKRLLAYEAAHAKVEDLRNQSFASITSGSFSVGNIAGASGTVQVSDDINGDGSPESDIVEVTVTVSYPDKGQAKSVVLRTFITDGGIIPNG